MSVGTSLWDMRKSLKKAEQNVRNWESQYGRCHPSYLKQYAVHLTTADRRLARIQDRIFEQEAK